MKQKTKTALFFISLSLLVVLLVASLILALLLGFGSPSERQASIGLPIHKLATNTCTPTTRALPGGIVPDPILPTNTSSIPLAQTLLPDVPLPTNTSSIPLAQTLLPDVPLPTNTSSISLAQTLLPDVPLPTSTSPIPLAQTLQPGDLQATGTYAASLSPEGLTASPEPENPAGGEENPGVPPPGVEPSPFRDFNSAVIILLVVFIILLVATIALLGWIIITRKRRPQDKS